jgi:hypothetical protein
MTKLQLNSQQTVKPQQHIRPPAIMFSIAVSTQGGAIRQIGEQKNVR